MKVLLVGRGGREHALGWKIAQSAALSNLFVDGGNPGLDALGEPVAIPSDPREAAAFAGQLGVDLVVVGPEAPLAAGLGDALRAAEIPCFGPDAAAAKLETSKTFMKEICAAVDAPTAAYGNFTEVSSAKAFLRTQQPPFVIKADGLAAGKGVIIAQTLEEADAAVDQMLGGKFGAASAEIVIEEFMHGEEASFFAISDGETVLPLIDAQDHKRAFDGDKGPNTGGMGAYSPAPIFTDIVRKRTMSQIIEPIVAEMHRRGTPYIGVIYAGLMIKDDAPRLVEINARFGDPECQVLMRRLESDLLPVLHAAATGALEGETVDWSKDAAALVVLAANGYPGDYEKGSTIDGLEAAAAEPGAVIFQAGTKAQGDLIVANGGRVLNAAATGPTIKDAIARAYAATEKIQWPDGFYRRDIGWRALER